MGLSKRVHKWIILQYCEDQGAQKIVPKLPFFIGHLDPMCGCFVLNCRAIILVNPRLYTDTGLLSCQCLHCFTSDWSQRLHPSRGPEKLTLEMIWSADKVLFLWPFRILHTGFTPMHMARSIYCNTLDFYIFKNDNFKSSIVKIFGKLVFVPL